MIFELFNPRGQQAKKIVKTENVNGFYNFSTATNSDAPTGNWNASVQVGGVYFSKTLKIETVMPNRLKIKLDFGADKIYSGKKVEGVLESRWLHGAIARNLKAQVDVTLSEISTQFKNLNDYVFDDPVKRFTTEQQTIFDGNLDNSGKANIEPDITPTDAAPGMLKANFTVRVFEEGGNFSIDRFSLDCSPYKSYVGVHSPDGEKYSGLLFTDTNHVIQVVTVDEDGKAVDRKDLTVKIYKLNWRWWWDRYDDNLANYLSEEYHSPYRELSTSTVNGKGRFVFRVDRPEWGRFLIHVTDNESGHSAGKIVFVDWPYWAGRSSKGDDKGAKMLQFSSDKDAYNVGDKIKLSIPTGEGSRALVSVEDGTRVLDAFWVDGQKGNTEVTLVAKPENSPNVYVFVSLIQPHAQTKNDLPVRMYGTLYIPVENPETHLYPEIKTTEFWRPEEKAVIKVSEKNNNPMTYTVAVVDDGLLDLTRFKTPDPWSYFFAREALGVKTWDLYDWIIGAYGAELKQLLAIGGDVAETEKGGKKANRFKPMVKFFGPYHLKKGKTATHEFTLPRYVGSVRVMVVAGNTPHSLSHREGEEGSYGSADITVPVKKPVMVLATLPRVVGPGETVDLPVTVFAMDKSVGNVKVEVEKNEFFEFHDGSSKTVSFSEPGDEVIYSRL
ncbi:MAG: hypothetical protein HYY40_05240, partial [Bacteroidetes bacterium]|nr:hypothetical protein [Bacteroidota bacterium]